MGQGSLWEYQVQLPNMTCDNCTLELIQVMDGDMTDPVPDPSTRGGTYFQCADIVLADGAPAGGLPPADPTDHLGQDLGKNPPSGAAAGAATGMAAASGSAAGSAAMAGSAGSSAAMGTAGTAGTTTTIAAMTGAARAAAGGMSLSGASNSASGNMAAAPTMSGMGPEANADGGCSFAYAAHASGWQVLVGFAGLISLGARRRKHA
jgi:hypothetical protein